MVRKVSRRQMLATVAALPVMAGLIAACSEEKAAEATPAEPAPAQPAPAEPAPAQPAAPAAEAPKAETTVDVAKLMEPGALPERQLGKDDAPVTIIEYASMTCPHCATFHKVTLPEIKSKYIDTGKARLILREFPFDPRAEAGFMLARCSDDRYFAMVDVLFQQQANWAGVENAREALMQISKLAGFSQESFEACLTDQKLLEDIRSVRERGAKDFGIESTPTFFINGGKYRGALSVGDLSAIIDSLL